MKFDVGGQNMAKINEKCVNMPVNYSENWL